jgi:hypothetical protein
MIEKKWMPGLVYIFWPNFIENDTNNTAEKNQ